jgi:carboxyl-terminal processing protease
MMARRKSLMIGFVIGSILALVFLGGFVAGAFVDRQSAAGSAANDPNLKDFVSAYNLVTQQSYFRPFNKRQLVYAAIDGMLSATGDPHTIFLSPPDNRSASQQLNGTGFSGIGAIVQPSTQGLEVLCEVPSSPSLRAGIRPYDFITRINGKPVADLSGDEAIARIHGKAGTTVRLTVVRGRSAPFTVPVRRAQIAPITACGRLLGNHLGYVQIFSFGDHTAQEVRQALLALRSASVRGIVLDLRGNPGGYVEAAQTIVSEFLGHGVVAYEQRSDHTLVPLNVIPGKQIVHVPVAVLVDDQSASAAEITAAALRDDGHAVLVGTRTYGKGSMQSVYTLGDGSTVRITDRLWLTPHRKSINKVGLQPNLPVSGGTGATDPQLTAAERYLATHDVS